MHNIIISQLHYYTVQAVIVVLKIDPAQKLLIDTTVKLATRFHLNVQ